MIVQLYHKVREKHPSGLGLFAYLYAFTIHILLILLRLNPRNLFAFLYKAYFLSRPSRYFEMIFFNFYFKIDSGTGGSQIIQALETIHIKKLIPIAVL